MRGILGDADALKFADLSPALSSALIEVECLRTLDRRFASGHLTADELALLRDAVYRILPAIDLVDLSPAILRRAAAPFPTPLGTLDALHLATALVWAEHHGNVALTIATHDKSLGRAARASGLGVVGC